MYVAVKFVLYLLLGFLVLRFVCSRAYRPTFGALVLKKNQRPIPRQITKVMVVAHPDDEVLWGFRELQKSPETWMVVCLTNAENVVRATEFSCAMSSFGVGDWQMWDK